MTNWGLRSYETFIGCVSSIGPRGCSVDQVVGRGDYLCPEIGWNVAFKSHASCFFQQASVFALCLAVLVGRVSLGKLSHYPKFLTKGLECMECVFPSSVRLDGLDSKVCLEFNHGPKWLEFSQGFVLFFEKIYQAKWLKSSVMVRIYLKPELDLVERGPHKSEWSKFRGPCFRWWLSPSTPAGSCCPAPWVARRSRVASFTWIFVFHCFPCWHVGQKGRNTRAKVFGEGRPMALVFWTINVIVFQLACPSLWCQIWVDWSLPSSLETILLIDVFGGLSL